MKVEKNYRMDKNWAEMVVAQYDFLFENMLIINRAKPQRPQSREDHQMNNQRSRAAKYPVNDATNFTNFHE
ncbi:hypothetical protein BH11BAC1_BH11BAC1_06430 [soil metagenome]